MRASCFQVGIPNSECHLNLVHNQPCFLWSPLKPLFIPPFTGQYFFYFIYCSLTILQLIHQTITSLIEAKEASQKDFDLRPNSGLLQTRKGPDHLSLHTAFFNRNVDAQEILKKCLKKKCFL